MRIVTLGSGTGQATLLRGLRHMACEVTALVGITDNGGHSGELRRLLHQPQVGDTRQCLSALVEPQSLWGQLLGHRFTEGELRGTSVGNLMLAALTQHHGSFNAAVAAVCQAVGLRQRIIPISDGYTDVGAELVDGQHVLGEWQIIQRQPRTAIRRLYLQPSMAAHPAALTAVAQADVLVLCPGSLLTGVAAVLLYAGLRQGLVASKARCIYVCNLMTQPGQSDDYTAAQHVALLHQYLGRCLDAVIVNTGTIPEALLRLYARHGSQPVVNDLTTTDFEVVGVDVVEHPDAETLRTYERPLGSDMQGGLHLIRHHAEKLATQILMLATMWQREGRAAFCS